MKTIGIIRKVDDLGRIVLPAEYRRALDISDRDEVEVILHEEGILLRKVEVACIFCSASHNLVSYRGKHICTDCIQNLNEG